MGRIVGVAVGMLFMVGSAVVVVVVALAVGEGVVGAVGVSGIIEVLLNVIFVGDAVLRFTNGWDVDRDGVRVGVTVSVVVVLLGSGG